MVGVLVALLLGAAGDCRSSIVHLLNGPAAPVEPAAPPTKPAPSRPAPAPAPVTSPYPTKNPRAPSVPRRNPEEPLKPVTMPKNLEGSQIYKEHKYGEIVWGNLPIRLRQQLDLGAVKHNQYVIERLKYLGFPTKYVEAVQLLRKSRKYFHEIELIENSKLIAHMQRMVSKKFGEKVAEKIEMTLGNPNAGHDEEQLQKRLKPSRDAIKEKVNEVPTVELPFNPEHYKGQLTKREVYNLLAAAFGFIGSYDYAFHDVPRLKAIHPDLPRYAMMANTVFSVHHTEIANQSAEQYQSRYKSDITLWGRSAVAMSSSTTSDEFQQLYIELEDVAAYAKGIEMYVLAHEAYKAAFQVATPSALLVMAEFSKREIDEFKESVDSTEAEWRQLYFGPAFEKILQRGISRILGAVKIYNMTDAQYFRVIDRMFTLGDDLFIEFLDVVACGNYTDKASEKRFKNRATKLIESLKEYSFFEGLAKR